jgi:hypothetical protein
MGRAAWERCRALELAFPRCYSPRPVTLSAEPEMRLARHAWPVAVRIRNLAESDPVRSNARNLYDCLPLRAVRVYTWTMRFGLDIAQQRVEFATVTERVILAEKLGFEGAWGFDHFVPMYGNGPGNCFEGMTTLAALTGRTQRIRLGLLVTGVTWRHPSVLASQAVTIDHASSGRLNLGLGAGWYEPEHASLGVPFPSARQRSDLLGDTLEILTRLFTGERVSYAGVKYSLENAQLLPRPVRLPRPPIWIGGSGPKRTLPLVAQFADVWHSDDISTFHERSRLLDELAIQMQRDPREIGRARGLSLSQAWEQVRRDINVAETDGITELICGWPSEGRPRVEEFAYKVMPEFAS